MAIISKSPKVWFERINGSKNMLWLLATNTTLGCLIASLVGYSVGLLLFTSVGTWFINVTGMQESFQAFQLFFDQYGFAAIIAMGILPIPFPIAMITAGLSGYPVLLFLLAALIARGLLSLLWLSLAGLSLWSSSAVAMEAPRVVHQLDRGRNSAVGCSGTTSTHALDDVTAIKQKTRKVAPARYRNPARPWQFGF